MHYYLTKKSFIFFLNFKLEQYFNLKSKIIHSKINSFIKKTLSFTH